MSNSMKDALQQQIAAGNLAAPKNKNRNRVRASLHEGTKWEDGDWVMFEPETEKHLHVSSVNHLFVQLRDAMRQATGDMSWAVRHASQVKRENMPFLHCASRKLIIFDPMGMFRDPVREFYSKKYFLWSIFPSQAYYFKPLEEVERVESEARLIRELREAEARLDAESQAAPPASGEQQ